jgi:hypothetical protein
MQRQIQLINNANQILINCQWINKIKIVYQKNKNTNYLKTNKISNSDK